VRATAEKPSPARKHTVPIYPDPGTGEDAVPGADLRGEFWWIQIRCVGEVRTDATNWRATCSGNVWKKVVLDY
jgi:hypothetical protein